MLLPALNNIAQVKINLWPPTKCLYLGMPTALSDFDKIRGKYYIFFRVNLNARPFIGSDFGNSLICTIFLVNIKHCQNLGLVRFTFVCEFINLSTTLTGQVWKSTRETFRKVAVLILLDNFEDVRVCKIRKFTHLICRKSIQWKRYIEYIFHIYFLFNDRTLKFPIYSRGKMDGLLQMLLLKSSFIFFVKNKLHVILRIYHTERGSCVKYYFCFLRKSSVANICESNISIFTKLLSK